MEIYPIPLSTCHCPLPLPLPLTLRPPLRLLLLLPLGCARACTIRPATAVSIFLLLSNVFLILTISVSPSINDNDNALHFFLKKGLSWWTEQSMCVAPCREGQFANPENGACIAVSGSIVCGDDTEYNARTGECTATDTPTTAPDQTTENEVSSNFCGEGTQYNTDEDTCVVTAESLLASSAMATIAVGPFTIPLWGLIAMAALLFCVLLTAIVGCCCCCGCCECSSVESGGDEGYRKYLPDSYTNPAWRQSYAAGSQA